MCKPPIKPKFVGYVMFDIGGKGSIWVGTLVVVLPQSGSLSSNHLRQPMSFLLRGVRQDPRGQTSTEASTMWGPQTIAKLVHITPITMVYDTYNYS